MGNQIIVITFAIVNEHLSKDTFTSKNQVGSRSRKHRDSFFFNCLTPKTTFSHAVNSFKTDIGQITSIKYIKNYNIQNHTAMAITYMTKEGYKKKIEEIAFLESVERPRISAAIAEARDKGDLSENSEYDAAKEAQGMLEMKIAQLKDLVANSRIIDESKLNNEEVQILNRVTIKNTANGMSMEYTIVADSEANLKEKKIGSSTPIAQGLLGHKLGEVVEIKVPAGLMKFEIVEINF